MLKAKINWVSKIDLERVKKSFLKDQTIKVEGKRIKKEEDVYKIFSKKMNFPEYFGNNWDAFKDLLQDLSWLNNKNFLVIINDIEIIPLSIFENLLEILIETSNYWALLNKNFRVFLVISDSEKFKRVKSIANRLEKEFENTLIKFPKYFGVLENEK